MPTPLLVDTSTTFEEYIKRLSRTSKKKYKKNLKETQDCNFSKIEYDSDLMWEFIKLWERQTVYGRKARWVFSKEQMDKMDTLVMFTIERDGIVAVHGIEKCDRFAYAHPPLYSKSSPELARFTWFNTIRWCCENDVDCLDMGGGATCDWPTLIKTRHKETHVNMKIRYKWSYVPKDVKDNPDLEKRVYQLRCGCGWKQLGLEGDPCKRCGG